MDDAGELLEVATQARKAWVQAVAARQVLQQHRTAMEAAEAANELGRRMVSVGNWSKLQQTQVQLAQSNARMSLRRAQYAAAQAEAALIQTLRLTGQYATVQLPDRLPDLPAQTLSTQQSDARAAAIAVVAVHRGAAQHGPGAPGAAGLRGQPCAGTGRPRRGGADPRTHQRRDLAALQRHAEKCVGGADRGGQPVPQAVVAAIEAQRDFWLAEADVQWAWQGGAPTSFVTLGGGGGESAAPAGH